MQLLRASRPGFRKCPSCTINLKRFNIGSTCHLFWHQSKAPFGADPNSGNAMKMITCFMNSSNCDLRVPPFMVTIRMRCRWGVILIAAPFPSVAAVPYGSIARLAETSRMRKKPALQVLRWLFLAKHLQNAQRARVGSRLRPLYIRHHSMQLRMPFHIARFGASASRLTIIGRGAYRWKSMALRRLRHCFARRIPAS